MDKLNGAVVTILLIIFGAIVHATIRLKVARDNHDETFTAVDYFILLPIAMFSGTIFYFIANIFFNNPELTNLFASVGGVLGVTGINFVGNFILDMLRYKLGGRHNGNDNKE